jgi:ApaLI-like restriction endonuclease
MDVKEQITLLAKTYADNLKLAMETRVQDMEADDTSHYLIYRVLGISDNEGKQIDVYQNKGRFLYKYAGSFLEAATRLCFKVAFPDAASLKIPNTQGSRPKTFEIDCLVDNEALEIKWKDATTDGDHITKEHTRIKVIAEAGYTPVRVMFYYPNRTQAIRIQKTLETLYVGVGGHYHFGDGAWQYVSGKTSVDLKAILEKIAAQGGVDHVI